MWDGYIGNQIRRANLRLLLVNAALMAGVLLLLGGQWAYLRTSFVRPTSIDPGPIARMDASDPRAHEIVQFEVGELFQTGFQQVETENGRQSGVKADYQAAWVGDRVLLVKTEPGSTTRLLAGELVRAPADVVEGLRKELDADKQALLLPVMLDTVEYRSDRWFMLVCIAVLAAIALWNLVRWSLRSRNFAAHPIVKTLGGEQVVREHGMQLDMEMTGGGQKFGAALLTASWIVMPTRFGARLMRLDDVAWAYRLVTKHSVNFIPTGSTHEAVVWGRHGATFSVQGPEARVNELLQAVALRAPWVVVGYSDELKQAFTKDRPGFLAAVDARRAQSGRAANAA